MIVGPDKRKGKKYSDFYLEEEEQAKRDGVV
jgi:hypothetical protein